MRNINKITIQFLLFITGFFCLNTVIAAPPFIIDDPEPTQYKQIELYLFSTMDKGSDNTALQLPGIEADWGFAPDWQFHIAAPIAGNLPKKENVNISEADDSEAGDSSQAAVNTLGVGDIETGITYRFIKETDKSPQVAIAPVIEWPTGDSERGLGNGRAWMRLPVLLKKSWGSWTTYGGGGYAINSAPDQQNYTFAGWVMQRDLSEKITLGGEVYTQGASSVDGQSYTLVNFGGNYNLNKHVSFLFSAGHSIVGEEHTQGYVGIHWVS
jgi:hypothetical protein